MFPQDNSALPSVKNTEKFRLGRFRRNARNARNYKGKVVVVWISGRLMPAVSRRNSASERLKNNTAQIYTSSDCTSAAKKISRRFRNLSKS
jgi:hypothetical protein